MYILTNNGKLIEQEFVEDKTGINLNEGEVTYLSFSPVKNILLIELNTEIYVEDRKTIVINGNKLNISRRAAFKNKTLEEVEELLLVSLKNQIILKEVNQDDYYLIPVNERYYKPFYRLQTLKGTKVSDKILIKRDNVYVYGRNDELIIKADKSRNFSKLMNGIKFNEHSTYEYLLSLAAGLHNVKLK